MVHRKVDHLPWFFDLISMKKFYALFLSLITFNAIGQTGQIDINRVNMMPNLPSPYEMRDWKDVARKYDEFIYDKNKTGQYLPLVGLKSNSTNYPNLQPILLQTYVGGSTSAAEAINIIPSIVGASLVGKDKSNQDGVNWVLKTKDFFNKANQQNIYLNNYSGISGGDWWYDVMPNIFFYQLYSLYPSDTDFQSQFVTVADRWLSAVYAMGGSSTPWTVPNMNYRGWRFATMTGNTDSVLEPESAGSIAWLLYNAYVKTGDKKYLDGAQMATEFLSNLNSNPSYELQLPYGTLVAARMNAEKGTSYNIDKMLNWSFDRGDLRGWGTIVGKWDGKDVSGLIGEANDGGNDYAFLMNGFQQAAAFAPVMKYDKRYARAIAKWTLNLANASRLMYSKYLPSNRQDDYTWSSTNDPESVIAYEALKEKNVYASNLPLYGTGDAKRNGWANTNLGLYGSSHVGYLGAIIETTDVDAILKIDVNKTDFFGQNAYPTYTLYNPYSSTKTVTLTLGANSYDIYDAISEEIIKSGVTGTTTIDIPANEVLLISYLPAGQTPVNANGKLMIGDNVVDYHYGYNFDPEFKVKSIAAEKTNYGFGSTAKIYATVDNAPAAVSYEWYVNDELITTTTTGILNWTVPSVEGEYTVVLKAVSDGKETSASVDVKIWEVVPEPPVVSSINTGRKFFYENETVSMIAQVTTAGTEKLSYEWNVTDGSLESNDSLLTWTAPSEGIYKISVTVSNRFELSTSYSVNVLVKKAGNGTTTDPLAYYSFDGDTKDHGGRGIDAQSSGVTLTADPRGQASKAYLFDDSGDIIFVPNSLQLNYVDATTLSCWVKATSINDEAFILSHGSWEERWKLSITPSGKLRWTVKTSEGVVDLDSSDPISLNRFYHVTVAYTGYSLEIYVDGELDTFVAHSGSLLQTTKPITFGRKDQDETRWALKGVLDEVRMYNKRLSPDEIVTLKTLWSEDETPVTGLEPDHSLRPYPNPARGVFSINTPLAEIGKISLTDISGRAMDFIVFDRANRTDVQINGDFRGMMLLKFSTGSRSFIYKVIAE